MAKFNVEAQRTIAGTTFVPTWASPGVTPTSICSALIDRNETLVSSTAAVSSGGGYYYALHAMPNTRGWYVNQWIAIINANTYRSRQFVEAVLPEVD